MTSPGRLALTRDTSVMPMSGGGLRRTAGVAVVLRPGGEEFGPGLDLRMHLEQRPPLAFGHAAPDTELHLVVECVGGALDDDGTPPANRSRFPLFRSLNEHFVGISGETPRLRHPCDAGFGRRDRMRHLTFPSRGTRQGRSISIITEVILSILRQNVALSAIYAGSDMFVSVSRPIYRVGLCHAQTKTAGDWRRFLVTGS